MIEVSLDDRRNEAIPVKNPVRVKHNVFTFTTFTPVRKVAFSLEPTAYTYLPNFVYFTKITISIVIITKIIARLGTPKNFPAAIFLKLISIFILILKGPPCPS